jgi:hypothetical protein
MSSLTTAVHTTVAHVAWVTIECRRLPLLALPRRARHDGRQSDECNLSAALGITSNSCLSTISPSRCASMARWCSKLTHNPLKDMPNKAPRHYRHQGSSVSTFSLKLPNPANIHTLRVAGSDRGRSCGLFRQGTLAMFLAEKRTVRCLRAKSCGKEALTL